LYRWHPWAGCVVGIHEVIEKASGDAFRCSRDGDTLGRWQELPVWMFDRASCARIQLAADPQVDLAALSALMALLRRRPAPTRHHRMPCFRAQQAALTTRIGETPMRRLTSPYHDPRRDQRQFDLQYALRF
jgi:hypothetical protein